MKFHLHSKKTKEKKKKNNRITEKSALEARTFSPRYLLSEIRKIRWVKWKSDTTTTGIGRNLGDTVGFMTCFALLSVLFNWIISVCIGAIG